MAKQHIILVLVASILSVAYGAASTSSVNLTADAASGTAYDILAKNNLPRGLLPKGVQSYVLSPNGKVEVKLAGECNFLVSLGGQQYKLQFASTFGGVVKAGSITEIYGVSAQIKYAWLGFSQVTRSGNQLTFQVQKFTQSFPVSNFDVSPSCS